MEDLKKFGEWFKEIRMTSGFNTQKELSEMSGVSRATISRIEAGIQRPDPETISDASIYLTSTTYDQLMFNAGYLKNEESITATPDWATPKDKRDLKKMLEEDGPVMFDGVPIDESARQRVMDILTGLFWDAKQMNKKTYGRKKDREGKPRE